MPISFARLHRLAVAEFGWIVEIGVVDDALEVVGIGQCADGDVDAFANVWFALESDEIVERATGRHVDQAVAVRLRLVGYVLHEEQGEHIVLVLGGIHTAPELIRAGPQRAVEL